VGHAATAAHPEPITIHGRASTLNRIMNGYIKIGGSSEFTSNLEGASVARVIVETSCLSCRQTVALHSKQSSEDPMVWVMVFSGGVLFAAVVMVGRAYRRWLDAEKSALGAIGSGFSFGGASLIRAKQKPAGG
jgi:hypothetical protein